MALESLLNQIQLRTIIEPSWHIIFTSQNYVTFHYRDREGSSVVLSDLSFSPELDGKDCLGSAMKLAFNSVDGRPKNVILYGCPSGLYSQYVSLLATRVFCGKDVGI